LIHVMFVVWVAQSLFSTVKLSKSKTVHALLISTWMDFWS